MGHDSNIPSAGEITRIRRNVVILVISLVVAIIVFALFYAVQPRKEKEQKEETVLIEQNDKAASSGLPSSMFNATYDNQRPQYARNSDDDEVIPADGLSPEQLKAYQEALDGLNKQRKEASEQLAQMKQIKEQLESKQFEDAQKALASPISYVNRNKKDSKDAKRDEQAAQKRDPYARIDDMVANATKAMVNATNAVNGAGVGSGMLQTPQGQKDAYYRTSGNDVETYQDSHITAQHTEFDLSAGTFIPGAMITGINTDLPGAIVGKITQNVFDSATGKHLLIPQGANVVGEYQSYVSNGQNRALIVWHTLTMPNGTSFALGGAPGTDSSGYAGISDYTDYHVGNLLTATAVTTGLGLVGNGISSHNDDDISILGDTLAQSTLQLGQKLIDQALAQQPTITIRPGWPFNIILRKNVSLAPYDG